MRMTCAELRDEPYTVGFLIPGIAIPYAEVLRGFVKNPTFRRRCAIAGIEQNVSHYVHSADGRLRNLKDTLTNQKLSYIVNCSVCDYYRHRQRISPRIIVGYSMGLYAGLYAAGYCTFETGLRIVEEAFEVVHQYCRSQAQNYAMGVILGLTEDEIRSLLFSRVDQPVGIALYNGRRCFVIAGEETAVDRCLLQARTEGAIRAGHIETHHPYHSRLLKPIDAVFRDSLASLEFMEPQCDVLSLVDAKVINVDTVIDTIVRSMYTPLRLDRAINSLVNEHHVTCFHETCPGGSMKKMVHYINKSVKVHPFGGDSDL